jgi:hypothetical protein
VLMNELAGAALPSQKFGANAAWLRLNVILYNLLSAYKRFGLPEEISHYPTQAAALFAAQHPRQGRPPRPRNPPALHQGDHTSPSRCATNPILLQPPSLSRGRAYAVRNLDELDDSRLANRLRPRLQLEARRSFRATKGGVLGNRQQPLHVICLPPPSADHEIDNACLPRRFATDSPLGGNGIRTDRLTRKPRLVSALGARRSRWPDRSAGCRPVPGDRARQKARQPA